MNDYRDFGYYFDDITSQMDYKKWFDFIKPFINNKSKILDLACGSLTFAILLKTYGYDVSGLDLSETMLEVGREKAKMNHLEIPLYHMDMTTFKIDRKFDCITCFFDSLNHLPTKEMVLETFNRVYEHLEDNGVFILDIFSEYAYNNCEQNLADDVISCSYEWTIKKINPNILHHNLIIHSMDDNIVENYYEYYYPLDLFTTDPRFQVQILSGDFEDNLNPTSGRILLVLRKR